jgi:hypothetical protein
MAKGRGRVLVFFLGCFGRGQCVRSFCLVGGGGDIIGKVCLVFDHRYSSMCVSVLSAEHTHTSKGSDDHMLNKPYHQV